VKAPGELAIGNGAEELQFSAGPWLAWGRWVLASKGGEVLAGGDVPVAIKPGFSLPAGRAFQDAQVFRVVEGVVADARRNETGFGFKTVLEGDDEVLAIPGVSDAAGVGGGVDAGGASWVCWCGNRWRCSGICDGLRWWLLRCR
jgi:hypothetical protein